MFNLHRKSHPFSSPLKSNLVLPTSSNNLKTACMIIPLSTWHVMLCELGINKLCETTETMWSSIATPFIFIRCDQTVIESFFDLEDFNLSTNHPTGWKIYNGKWEHILDSSCADEAVEKSSDNCPRERLQICGHHFFHKCQWPELCTQQTICCFQPYLEHQIMKHTFLVIGCFYI